VGISELVTKTSELAAELSVSVFLLWHAADDTTAHVTNTVY